MKTLQDYIDKLNALNFKDMYNSDFFLTWEKTDDPIPDWYIRSNATSRPGSFQKTTKSQKLWKKPTRDFTEKKGLEHQRLLR